MGYGNDVIVINGFVGQFIFVFSNVFDVMIGIVDNELIFGGILKLYLQIKGVFFNCINECVGFFYGLNC